MCVCVMMMMNVLPVVIVVCMGLYVGRVLRFGRREWGKGVGEGSGGREWWVREEEEELDDREDPPPHYLWE